MLIEGGVRLTKVADVPLFLVDQQIGYVPAPGQHGAVLWTHDWAFNERSMATPQAFTGRGVLLIGDSVVCGGNPFSQAQRLGSRLEAMLGRDVWPVCAGGWSLANELAFIRRHPEVENLDTLVFVINPGDDVPGSTWQGEAAHPTRRPLSQALYAFLRWGLKDFHPSQAAIPPWRPEMRALLQRYKGRVLFVLYPQKDPAKGFAAFSDLAPAVRISMRPDQYRDLTHPTVDGTVNLAAQIARALQ